MQSERVILLAVLPELMWSSEKSWISLAGSRTAPVRSYHLTEESNDLLCDQDHVWTGSDAVLRLYVVLGLNVCFI